MLERTAGCLESGSLRRLLPGPSKSLKSRRMLHSAFWNHGAVELELSPLWTALIGGSDVVDEHDEKHFKSAVSASARVFLDFLYPSGALKFIRQCSSWKSDRKDIQRSRTGFTKLGQRLYTSLANEAHLASDEKAPIFPGTYTEGHRDTVRSANELSSSSTRPRLFLQSLIDTRTKDDYDDAWRQYELSGIEGHRQAISRLLKYLSTSHCTIDAERSISVFEKIRSVAGKHEYRAVIRSHLILGNVQNAIQLHREAFTKSNVLIFPGKILALLLDNSHWRLACELWADFQAFRSARGNFSYNIWKHSDGLPTLPDRALELARFVKDEVRQPTCGGVISSAAPIFASMLVNRALLVMSDAESLEPSKVATLLKVLQEWNTDTPERYEGLISAFIKSGHTKVAIQCYRKYRQRTTTKISRPILDELLRVACKYHSILGMQQILDDWFRFYGRPSGAAYRMSMSEFAGQGDVVTVKALFDQYMANIKQDGKVAMTTADDIAPLMHVHAKRGELSEVLKIFDGIEEEFGVKPNIKSWNILINAYGKLHDVDGAFCQFEKLLDSPIRPDSYTFGTMMGICITRGDLEQALELDRMAEAEGIARSTAMVDCLVLGHVQDDRLLEAEKICEDTLLMDLESPPTRMWNYLLTAYAMRRDLDSTNRILRRMKNAGVNYDASTYSALMQALAMVKQPDRAAEILNNVMPEAGVIVTNFHYAIVMGGYIATGELQKVFRVHRQMLKRNIRQTVSTRIMTIKASAMEDQRLFECSSEGAQLTKAEQYFHDAYSTMDAQEIADSQKAVGRQPLDVVYSAANFDYLIFVYGQRNAFDRVRQLYTQFLDKASAQRRDETPLKILSALMVANLREKNYEGVQQGWELAFQQARKQGQAIRPLDPPKSNKVLPIHRLALSIPLSTQITSLGRQRKFAQLSRTVEDVEAAGFVLDSKNWNLYIQLLTKTSNYNQAFELCESKLMDGWTGWARLRWMEPRRNRLAVELRNLRRTKSPIHLRPVYHTLLYLAKAYSELHDSAAESENAGLVLDDLEHRCPRTLQAVKTMQRVDDDLEREVLLGSDWGL